MLAGLVVLAPLPAVAALCDAEGAIAAETVSIRADGTLRLEGNIEARLQGVIWPDRLEARRRAHLIETINAALAGQKLAWKAVGLPDRWGVLPIHLFVREAAEREPFWLQAGLVEQGHVAIWPDGLGIDCLARLEVHERRAIALRRGHWAPRAQAFRLAMLGREAGAQQGRRVSFLMEVGSVRPWRALHFINRAGEERGNGRARFAVAIPNSVVSELTKSGDNPRDWVGRRVLIRAVMPVEGLSRLRIETIERIRPLGPVRPVLPTRL